MHALTLEQDGFKPAESLCYNQESSQCPAMPAEQTKLSSFRMMNKSRPGDGLMCTQSQAQEGVGDVERRKKAGDRGPQKQYCKEMALTGYEMMLPTTHGAKGQQG